MLFCPADAISESLKPGFVLFGKLIGRSLVTRGVGGATGLLLYRSEYNMINGALETDLATLDAIEGKEHEWLSDVVPTYFPKVCSLKQCLQQKFDCVSGVDQGDRRPVEDGSPGKKS